MKVQAVMVYLDHDSVAVETVRRTFELREFPIFGSDAAEILLPEFELNPKAYRLDHSAQIGSGAARVYSGIDLQTGEPLSMTVMRVAPSLFPRRDGGAMAK